MSDERIPTKPISEFTATTRASTLTMYTIWHKEQLEACILANSMNEAQAIYRRDVPVIQSRYTIKEHNMQQPQIVSVNRKRR